MNWEDKERAGAVFLVILGIVAFFVGRPRKKGGRRK